MLKISKSGCRWIYTSTSSVQELLTELINKFREVEKAKEEGIIQFESYINLTKIMRSVQKRIRSFNKEPDKNIGNVEISPKS